MPLIRKPLLAAIIAVIAQCGLVAAFGRHLTLIDFQTEAALLTITGLSAGYLYADAQPCSLNQIWWMFSLIFFGITPALQVAMHRTPWHTGDILPAIMLGAAMVIISSLLLYLILSIQLIEQSRISASPFPVEFTFSKKRFYALAFILIIVCAAILVKLYGITGLFLRSIAEAKTKDKNTTLMLLGDKAARGILMALSMLSIHYYRQKKIAVMPLLAILLAVLVLACPLAVPRYLVLTIYGSWGIIFFKEWLGRHRYFFRTVLLSILLLAAPLTAVLRHAGTPEFSQRLSSPAALLERTYLVADFDAYSSLCRAMQFTELHGNTKGRQLAGAALFFIPRKIWPEKPVGSGAMMFSTLNFETGFLNVSCAYFAEGWLNFGMLGVILFTVLMTIFIVRYDALYRRGKSNYRSLFYPAMMGLLLLMLRGDLLSSFAYTIGLYVAGYFVFLLSQKKQTPVN